MYVCECVRVCVCVCVNCYSTELLKIAKSCQEKNVIFSDHLQILLVKNCDC